MMVSDGTQRAFSPVEAFEKMGSVPTFPRLSPKGIEMRHTAVPAGRCRRVGATAIAGVAALLLVRQPAAKEPRRPTFKFDSLEMQKYRIELAQVRQDSGITSGFFFAYGHYVIPPYVVTARDGSTYVNGIRVHPLVERPGSTTRRRTGYKPPNSDPYWLVSSHLYEVEIAAQRLYDSILRTQNDTARAIREIKAFLLADSLVDSARVSRQGFLVYGRRSLCLGKYIPVRHYVWFAGPQGPPPDTSDQRQSRQNLAEVIAGSIRGELQFGRCRVNGWGADASRNSGFVRIVSAAMSMDSLTPERQWLSLVDACGAPEAYGYVANWANSRGEWSALKTRLEAKR
jgi:hypothetical protein